MKRIVFILTMAVTISIAGYFTAYHLTLHPTQCPMDRANCGMAWLRREYHLTDAQYAKIARMHDDYRPSCDAMCRRVAEANDKLAQLIAANSTVTPEIEAAFQNWTQLRNQCRIAMLRHVYAVSTEMPPEDGKRYIRMATARIAAPGGMAHAALLSK